MSSTTPSSADAWLELKWQLEDQLKEAKAEIERLRGVNSNLLHAAKTGAEWMRWWIDQDLCECESGHICGKREREKELEQIETALKSALDNG